MSASHAPRQLASSAPTAGRPWARRLAGGLVLSALLASATPSSALTDEEVFRAMRFQTVPMGARALGLGGAFIGQADDPTAVHHNPGGLAFLSRPEAHVTILASDPDPYEFTTTGEFDHVLGPTVSAGRGVYDDQSVLTPAVLAYAHPIGEHVVIAGYRYEQNRVDREASTGYFTNAFVAGQESAALSTEGDLEMLVENWGVSVGVSLHETFALGLSLGLARADVTMVSRNRIWSPSGGAVNADLDYETIIDDEDTVFTFVGGARWQVHPKIALGAVYRDGPEFDLVERLQPSGARAAALQTYLVALGVADSSGRFINRLNTPDSYGGGMSFGPFFEPRGGGGLMVNVDAVRVEYTDLLDSFVQGLNNQMFAGDSGGTVVAIEDETEVHLGVSYTWTVGYNNKLHVRGGVYNEPDVSLLVSGRAPKAPGNGFPPGAFAGRDDDENIHVTLGAGFTLKRGFFEFELDATADVSDLGQYYVGSAAFRF